MHSQKCVCLPQNVPIAMVTPTTSLMTSEKERKRKRSARNPPHGYEVGRFV
jgi:hypothetical protein